MFGIILIGIAIIVAILIDCNTSESKPKDISKWISECDNALCGEIHYIRRSNGTSSVDIETYYTSNAKEVGSVWEAID